MNITIFAGVFMKQIFSIILIFLVACFKVFGQKQDSVVVPKTLFLTSSGSLLTFEQTKTDTDFNEIHNYRPFYSHFLANLGNGVSATYSLIPHFENDLPFWLQPMAVYYDEIQQLFFQTHSPFTHVRLTGNTNRTYNEEGIKIIHTQNINPNWNIAFIGKSDKQIGRIPRQDNRFHYLYGSSRFNSATYQFAVNYFFSKIKVKENGGVSNLSFLTDSLFPAENAQVFRSDATNNYMYQKAEARQAICLNYRNDSLSVKWKPYIIHTLQYQKAKKIYRDIPDSSQYYIHIFNDSTNTYDSLYIRNLENRIGLAFSTNIQHGNGVYIYALSSLRKLYSFEHPHTEQNTGAGLQFFYNDSLWAGHLTYEHWIQGYFAKNKTLSLELSKNIRLASQKLKLVLLPSFRSSQPDFFMNELYTNHFQWDNSIPMYSELSADLGVENNANSLFLTFKRIQHASLFDSLSNPRIDSNYLKYAGLVLKKTWRAGHFHLSNRFFIQFLSDTLISVPTFSGYHILYYENQLFKKVLGLQIGAEVFYHAKYNAVSYNPALGSFYNPYSTKLGNYPYINVFVDLKLKRARFFIKIEHLNYHWQQGNYCLVKQYPLPPRSLKFGIFWSFYD
ncbi:MAG: putative porin [Bacteroidales bacterium]